MEESDSTFPLLDPCVGRNPVDFPGLAPILREGLFKMAGSRRDVGDHESNKDGAAIVHFLVVELPSSVLELPDRGLAQATAAVARKVKAPLMGFGVVQTQAHSFNVARWA